MGIRPGAVEIVSGAGPEVMAAVVERDEFHGETRLVALTSGAQNFMAAIPPATRRVTVGETLLVRFPPEATHIFDTASGKRI